MVVVAVVNDPVGLDAGVSVGLGLAARLRAAIPESADEQRYGVLDEGAGFRFVDVGQVVAPDVAEFASVPGIRLAGVGVQAGDDDLLAATQKLDLLLALVERKRFDVRRDD